MKGIVRRLLDTFQRIKNWAYEEKAGGIYAQDAPSSWLAEEIHSIWDYLVFAEHTQAAHIASVIGFEEWVDMKEIRRRIKELFGAEYQNDRSLYPYIKTLSDAGLLETTNIGGSRKWRKKELIIKIGQEVREAPKEKAAEIAEKKKKALAVS